MNDEARAREQLVELGQGLFARGLTPGRTGNLSVRLGDKVLMTPSGSSLGRLDPESLSVVSMAGDHQAGLPPTKEVGLHLALYRRQSGRAIVHLHSPYAVGVSCMRGLDPSQPIVPLTPYFVMRAGGLILVPYHRPGSSDLVQAVDAAAQHSGVLLLQRHGSLVLGETLGEAADTAEEIEQSARLAIMLGGAADPLSRAEVMDIAGLDGASGPATAVTQPVDKEVAH